MIRPKATGVAQRPALLTAIAVLELAAAAWDGNCFIRMSSAFSSGWSDNFAWFLLMPALMAVAAIYAGVGLLQMRREAVTVWMLRHMVLGGIYLLTLPIYISASAFCPAAATVLYWRVAVLAFSVAAGAVLLGQRSLIDNRSAR